MYNAATNCTERRVDGAEDESFAFQKNIENEPAHFV
jgi:hypothetical protein